MAVQTEERINDDDDNNNNNDAAKTRLYVGGLGASVTADDMRKTFSSLGKVQSVEIVRTKSRSFAYFDFVPYYDNALSKLISTYNGCLWKGGRLKIEKAKEHYLLRLRREWAEDAELASRAAIHNVDAAEKVCSSEKLKKVLKLEKTQLRIFFPKLRKVKLIPFAGAGKHKYSFQRLDVPPFPMHFCDCEEHSYPSHNTKEEPLSDLVAEADGINEKELNMMVSVMNRLLGRENCSESVFDKVETAKEEVNSVNATDDMRLDENDTERGTDDDNLITNIFLGTKDQMTLLGRQEVEAIRVNQKSESKRARTSKDKSVQKVRESEKKKDMHSNRKRKPLLSEEDGGNKILSFEPRRKGSLQTHLKDSEAHLDVQTMEPDSSNRQSSGNLSWSQKSTRRDLVGERSNGAFHFSNLMPNIASREEEPRSGSQDSPSSPGTENQNFVRNENLESQQGQSKEPKELSEAAAVTNKIARGASWLQKSSWTQLVSNSSNNSFSISQILPGTTFKKEEMIQSNSMDAANSTTNKQHHLFKSKINESTTDGSNLLTVSRNLLTAHNSSNAVALAKQEQKFDGLQFEQGNREKLESLIKNNDVSASKVGKKNTCEPKQTCIEDSKTGETCSFMRSAASVKEWMNAKAALSGSLKKKGNEK